MVTSIFCKESWQSFMTNQKCGRIDVLAAERSPGAGGMLGCCWQLVVDRSFRR